MEKKEAITGIISSRKCPYCGHHEIGITTNDGKFYSLKPGTHIQILSFEYKTENQITHNMVDTYKDNIADKATKSVDLIPWLPEILRRNKRLRLKYGIFIDSNEKDIDSDKYKIAFIKKLQYLIEKETYPELCIILDKIFHSPHLASENSAETVINILRDIDKVKETIELMSSWIQNKTEEIFLKLIAPLSKQDLNEPSVDDNELFDELDKLTLEDFLRIL